MSESSGAPSDSSLLVPNTHTRMKQMICWCKLKLESAERKPCEVWFDKCVFGGAANHLHPSEMRVEAFTASLWWILSWKGRTTITSCFNWLTVCSLNTYWQSMFLTNGWSVKMWRFCMLQISFKFNFKGFLLSQCWAYCLDEFRLKITWLELDSFIFWLKIQYWWPQTESVQELNVQNRCSWVLSTIFAWNGNTDVL